MHEILVWQPRAQMAGDRLTAIAQLRLQAHVDIVLQVEIAVEARRQLTRHEVETALPRERF